MTHVQKYISDHKYLQVFLLCLLTASLTILPFIIKNHGLFTIIDDFNSQQIPFNMQSSTAIKQGNIFWNWNTDLGSNFIGAYSFYTLGSPFFWISLIFPASFFPYLIGPLLILKYCTAGMTSFAYIKRYVKNKEYAVLGSLLYAFSGFSTVNLMFNHFHDVVALFPLVMVGMDKLVLDKKPGFFLIAVAINVLLNYFFFIGEIIFLVLYFIFRFLTEDFKKYIRRLSQVAFEAIIGVGIGCILFIPSILFTFQNPRTHSFLYGTSSIIYDGSRYLMLLKSILMPADIMSDQSAILPNDWTSSSAYLPLIGISLIVSFLLVRKNWMAKMIKISIVFALLPFLNSSFYVFNAFYYARWFYMPVLICALVSAVVLDQREAFNINRGLLTTFAATIIFVLYLLYFPWHPHVLGIVFHMKLFMTYVAMAILGLLITFFLLNKMKGQKLTALMMIFIVIFSSLNGFINIQKMKEIRPNQSSEQIYNVIVKTGLNIKLPDGPYRANSALINDNLSMIDNYPSVSSFTSTVNGSIFDFYHSIGDDRAIVSSIPSQDYGLVPFLSVKYYLTTHLNSHSPLIEKYNNGTNTVYAYQYKNTLPIGFTYNYFLTNRQFMNIPVTERHFALLKAIVIPDNDVKKLNNKIKQLPGKQMQQMNAKYLKRDLINRKSESSYFFHRYNSGFTSKLRANHEKMAFFSVPYDKGWSAADNNKKVPIIETDGFMSIPVSKGNNVIRFSYMTPGLKKGALISLISILILITYLSFLKVRDRRRF
ncbi:YfhO family protein [Sporolactobacillus pectinivorans]|uniref:YfhO family protein n=1 Tax=Sporolactobacillus pectinivorans TaxID=1591408 RepID=UPI001EFD6851|nr:YfhO family protein [Sporolactobacillus pectinivorans]